jgi:RimJ/RimL family protein N-acetyltransferase
MHHGDLVPVLTDGVVRLDAHHAEDVDAHVAGEDEETAKRFGWWPERSTPRTVLAAYLDWSDEWVSGGPRRAFAVRSATDGRLVGGCELRVQPDEAIGHVSYWTHSDDRGRGYAVRALTLLVAFAADQGVSRVESHVDSSNLASRHVSEQAGFTLAGEVSDDDGAVRLLFVRALR